jgi:hypothetical protein
MKRDTRREVAEDIIRPTKVIPACHVKARCVQLLSIIYILWKNLKLVEERRERRMVGMRIIHVLM